MKIFDPKFPHDQRHDSEKNGKVLNVVFHGATFGNFIKLFVEKFSKKTGEIDVDPFTDIGTAHSVPRDLYSGKVQAYHPAFINDNEGETGLNICIPLPTTHKHFLYLKLAMHYRPKDRKHSTDDLWKIAIGEMPTKEQKRFVQEIVDLYQIKDICHYHWLPKFIVRDWFKQGFLQRLEDTHLHQWFKELTAHPFWKEQNVYHLDLEAFFNYDFFIDSMTSMDEKLSLDIDFSRSKEMNDLWQHHFMTDSLRHEAIKACDAVELKEDVDTRDLQVATEAFIYAELEKMNPDIIMPIGNRFFRDSEEIRQFIENYPNWYRRKNPNLPQK